LSSVHTNPKENTVLSNQPAIPQASTPSNTKAGEAEAPVPLLNPRGIIEVAATGTGTTNDPAGKDKPPAVYESDLSSPDA
jgi:hypothetical protein